MKSFLITTVSLVSLMLMSSSAYSAVPRQHHVDQLA